VEGRLKRRSFLSLAAALPALASAPRTASIAADVLEDKIRGGFLGQVLGDLNGLPHEMKYIAEPGNVETYTPALPEGGWTDDDTDVEWPYIVEMQQSGRLLIPYPRIAELWKSHINRRIWCSHLYLRQLLDLGIEPPLTGRIAINPWVDFNLAGQFVSESWGLISPGMPRTAARIGAHYLHVAVDSEPVQSMQMMASMIAVAFFTTDRDRILDAGAAAVDPHSVMHEIIVNVRQWHREHPGDWRATRRLIQAKYSKFGGEDMRDRNGVWLNGACTIAALLYGAGDWVQSVKCAFNLGWDADNNAAGVGAILGVVKGHKWMSSQGWNILDRYRNTSRDNMPENETLTSYADRLVALAARNIVEQGGSKSTSNGRALYRIRTEQPANVEPLGDIPRQTALLRSQLRGEVEDGIRVGTAARERARAAYLAICLDFAPELKQRHPAQWTAAIQALEGYPNVLQVLFYESPIPAGARLREKAVAAGLRKPAEEHKIWV
jgi:hypothetical protein